MLVLIAALAHALWNLASKDADGDTFVFVWAYTALSGVLCLVVTVTVPMSRGETRTWSLALAAFVSAALHVVYSLVLQRGYRSSDVGLVYPVARGTGPLLTLIVAIALLGERPGVVATLGALLIIAGVVVVIGNPFVGGTPLGPLLWGVATGASISAYTLWDSYSIATLHLQPVTYFAATLILETLLLSPWAVQRRSAIPKTVGANLRAIGLVAILSPLAYILVLTALQTLPVAIVAPLRESSIVIAALLAWWLFHERHVARRIAGAAVVLGGIALISLR